MELPAERLSAHLESLSREIERLEQMLMLDGNWRALKQLEAREASGDAADFAAERTALIEALSSNRIFTARTKLVETVRLLGEETLPEHVDRPESKVQTSLADRMVLLDGSPRETFRTRIRARAKSLPAAPAEAIPQPADVSVPAAPAVAAGSPEPSAAQPETPERLATPDALELIDGLSRHAAEVLRDHGVHRFQDIARWTADDVAVWRLRLDGLVSGEPGSWIEQAALLGTGARTCYAQRARSGDFTALVPSPEPLLAPQPIGASASSTALARADTEAAAADGSTTTEADTTFQTLFDTLVTDDSLLDFGALARPDMIAPSSSTRQPKADDAESAPTGSEHGAPRGSLRRALEQSEPRQPVVLDSEVVVINRDPQLADVVAAQPRPKAQKLLRRLKQVLVQDKFEAEGYAAYRAVVEEASVTIVRPEDTRSRAGASPSSADAPRHNKFLKALTGDD